MRPDIILNDPSGHSAENCRAVAKHKAEKTVRWLNYNPGKKA